LRLLDQDRNLELQRSREHLEQVADLALAQVTDALKDWELGVRELQTLPPAAVVQSRFPQGTVFIAISDKQVEIYPKKTLLFTPLLPVPPPPEPGAFDGVDDLEFREQQYKRAMALLKPLVLKPRTRTEALLRLARIEYKASQPEDALATYAQLANEDTVTQSGTPYALSAMSARCRILMELGRKREAQVEASSLRAALLEGRWPISRETFAYHWANLKNLGLDAGEPPKPLVEFAALVAGLLSRLQNARLQGLDTGGREFQPDSSLLVWNARPAGLTAVVAPPDWLNSAAKLPAGSGDIRWKPLALDKPREPGFIVARSLSDAGIPLRLEFSSTQPASGAASNRRALFLAGAILTLMVILSAGYVVHRAISRELQVAQLQSDFVAAVSHEFRAPLTTLRTITELLVQHRITTDSRRQQSYVFLDHETTRLHQLVEDLLDFGRMESGRKQYHAEDHDAFRLVRAAVDDFVERAKENGFSVETEFGSSNGSAAATIHVDQEAFGRALRNLLENAMKYSPVCRTVWVDGAVRDDRVMISVRDRGMGIGTAEQRAVFQKFVRGEAAKKAGIKGTGIGLAMVQQIVQAMGGEISLHSEVGVGSTFTLVIPLVNG
jgi:signal transduction histidine kinase